MEQQLIHSNRKLATTPSATSSSGDFDFFIGHWNIFNRKPNTRLNGCAEWIEFEAYQEMQTILNGIGNTDHFKTTLGGKPFEGMTLRLFTI